MKSGDIIDCGEGLWNVRGSYRIKGLIDVGTHASLVAMPGGGFAFLDSLTLEGDTLERIMGMTEGGKAVEAILNLHPFHTLHCEWASRYFPQARLYGTARHKKRMPGLRWEDDDVDSPAVAARFSHVLDLSKPDGVDFISANEKVHFSSLLALHRASGTIHSDDTLSYTKLPFPLSLAKADTGIFFHPTLGKALEKRPGAADEFRGWARQLAQQWDGARRLCAAHNGILDLSPGAFAAGVMAALAKVEPVLAAHDELYR